MLLCQQGHAAALIELDLKEHRLENGLRLLINEDHSAPVISFQIWYHVGSINERPGITGISHLFEHMMFKGSRNVEPEQHSKIVRANGGTDNAFTTEDATAYFENLPSSKLALAAELEADRMAHLRLTARTLASEREVVKEERRLRIDNSLYGTMAEAIYSTAFTVHPYRWPVNGWMSNLDAITLEDCREYYRTHYAPNNATIILLGDVDTQEAISTMEKYFGGLPPARRPDAEIPAEPRQEEERRKDLYVDTQSPWLAVAYHIPEAAHNDIPVLELIGSILTDGHSSRLYKKIIHEDRAALYVSASPSTNNDPGLFIITVRNINEGHSPDEIASVIYDSLEQLKTEAVTGHELEKAGNQIETDLIYSLQTNFVRGLQMGFSLTQTGDPQGFIKDLEKYRTTTADDIKRVAEKYFAPENRTVVRLLPKKE
ncbi:MAG: pitrilysin family protein [Candidatus Brocadiales bacterium]